VPVAVPVAAVTPRATAKPRQLVKKPRLRRGMPTWAVGGIAASVVGGMVIGGAFWLRSQLDVNHDLLPSGNGHTPVVVGKPVSKNEASQTPPNAVDQLIAQVIRGSGETYGEGKSEPIVPPKAEPVRFAFGDLKKQDKMDSLKWELAQSSGQPSGVHLDVTVKYDARSLNRIIESFHKQGVQLVVTPPAEASLAKNRPLLVYAENINADQLALALRDLSEADIQGKKKVASTFETLRVSPGSLDDHKRTAEGLGIDAKQLSAPGSPASKASAVGVVLSADRPKAPSTVSEIRAFLAGRGPVQNGALQVFLHLEPTGK
jgi:hypothetical protein